MNGGMVVAKHAVKRILAIIAGWLPDFILSRIVPRDQRFLASDVKAPGPAPAGIVRVFIGPTNSAGQGWQWMRAAERNLSGVGAVVMGVTPARSFEFPVDQSVPLGVYRWSRKWQAEQATFLAKGFDRIILESGRPLLGDAFGRSARQDVNRLRDEGKSVALLFHGTDIRLPSRHAKSNEWSPFREGVLEQTPILERQARRNRQLVEETGCPSFYSTPDLSRDLPVDARWLPVVIDVDRWRSEHPPSVGHEPLRVAHAPSRAAFKGTALIDPVLRELERAGVVEYLRIEDVPAARMPDLYRGVDVVLDQFSLGSYGVAACEAMAAGRIVVSNVSDDVRRAVHEQTGNQLPIVQADPSTLEALLRDIADDPTPYFRRAMSGVSFVQEVHDGRRSADVLSSFLRATGAGST